jgi:hypothetical protein
MAKPRTYVDKEEAQKELEKQMDKEPANETDRYPQYQKDSSNIHFFLSQAKYRLNDLINGWNGRFNEKGS